jgi:predicted restriction endonuclease
VDDGISGALADFLSGGQALGAVTQELLQGAVDADAFDPKTAEDARRRVLAAIAQRQGQPKFRKKLMAAYGSRCPISNCDFLEALEAAHILAYRGPETNHVQNGICYGPICTLFLIEVLLA